MPTLGLGWRSYRVSELYKFPLPIPLHGRDSQLVNDASNIEAKLFNKHLNKADRTSAISSIDNIIGKLYGISQADWLNA
jgi:hypothetical protein